MTLGEKIQRLRKSQGLSQEGLAEKVSVTRQTISKWELNQSTPDLDSIARLSDLFGVSADYLIRKELTQPDAAQPQARRFHLTAKGRRSLFFAVSLSMLLAGCICLICDYFTAGALTWSLVVLASLAAGWLLLLPFLTAASRLIFKSLCMASIVPFPLLGVLALLLGRPLIFLLGSCVALLSILVAWAIYAIFRRFRPRLGFVFGLALLVLVPFPAAVTLVVSLFLPSVSLEGSSAVFNGGIALALSLACFGWDYLRSNKDGPQK